MIGSTNNPEMIDPALLHRPARFDRVYHFELPDRKLRERYVRELFCDVPEDIISDIVRGTDKWSFAYMNELRICSAFISIEQGLDKVDAESIMKALDMLSEQFKNTKDPSKLVDEKQEKVGFY
jgi:ATP-dependent 26S proteasome regulatory subunit